MLKRQGESDCEEYRKLKTPWTLISLKIVWVHVKVASEC